jgi:hypothetical protein
MDKLWRNEVDMIFELPILAGRVHRTALGKQRVEDIIGAAVGPTPQQIPIKITFENAAKPSAQPTVMPTNLFR